MNRLQIQYFLDASDAGSFSAAAKQHYISQPAISRVISDLEEELDAVLFVRKKKGIELTKAGKLYYDLFHDFMFHLNQTAQAVKDLEKPDYGTIKIAILANYNVSKALKTIRTLLNGKYPHMQVQTLICSNFLELIEKLNSFEADAAITLDQEIHAIDSIDYIPLEEGERLLVYAKNHPAAKSTPLSPAAFRNEPFVLLEKEGRGARIVRDLCRPFGFEPVFKSAPNIESIVMDLQNVEGVAVLSSWARITSSNLVGTLSLNDPIDLIFLWKKNNPNQTLKLAEEELKRGQAAGVFTAGT